MLFHCDATQWVGKMPASVGEGPGSPLACDLLSFSPHKFHGAKGVGVLYSRPGVRTATLIHGEQELGRRGGTENSPGIVGAGVAAELAMAWLTDETNIERGRALRDRFERAVRAGVPDVVVNGEGQDRLWNTSSIGFPGWRQRRCCCS